MTDPGETLDEHEDRIREWLDQLRDRRETLATLRTDLLEGDREEIPAELRTSLGDLLETLAADLDSQIDDLEGDLEMIAELRGTFGDVDEPAIEAELEEYTRELDEVFDDKRAAIEELLDATDRLIDRFEDLVTGRYLE